MRFAELPGVDGLCKTRIDTLQVNVGDRCNQSCRHCHASGGRDGVLIARGILEDTRGLLREQPGISTVDITGGSPELHLDMPWYLGELLPLKRKVIFRTNLTALGLPEGARLVPLLVELRAELLASLPGVDAATVDAQRGAGVFERSLEMLRDLNHIGFGTGALSLALVYNPPGPTLPPPQGELEARFRSELLKRHGLRFDRLYAMANQPLGRLRQELIETGALAGYQRLLRSHHNPGTLGRLMCGTTLTVGSDGRLFDCEFNRAAGLPLRAGAPATVGELRRRGWSTTRVAVGDHCYACTAGTGFS